MPAPGTLFGEATQALEGASSTAQQTNEIAQKDRSNTIQAGEAAGAEVGATGRQAAGAQDAQKLAELHSKLNQAENMFTMTAQIASGLTKNTGDPEWFKSVGQPMRADVAMSLYTHGMALANEKKSPKVTLTYGKDGKVSHTLVWQDADGNPQQVQLDEGAASEVLNKGKGGGKKGGVGGSDEELKKMKEFNRAYEKARAEVADPARAAQLKATNPDDFSSKQQFLKDNQDQYDANIKALGKGGGAAVPGAAPAAGGGGDGGSAPFDADAFIKDALGQ
jgi:hypothetical protein